MKTTLKLIGAFIFLAGISAAQAADWTTYSNDSYKFSVEYPKDLFEVAEKSENGDGINLRNADSSVEFRAYGFNNGDELPLTQVRDIILEDSDGRTVTYKAVKNNWIVISGTEEENGRTMIFYQRLAASSDLSKFSAFEFIYPQADKTKYDALLKRMSLSLKAPQ